MKRLQLIVLLCVVAVLRTSSNVSAEPIPIGISTALTGDAVQFGEDIKNGIVLANDLLGQGRYRLIIEDEKCENKDALSVANKLIHVDNVKYVLGFPCNSTLLTTAPVYDRANVTVITASGNSGDVLDVGSHIFRLFPADSGCADVLYRSVAKEHRQLTILTEQNEYPVMMERTIRKLNSSESKPLKLESIEYSHGQTDLRTTALKVRGAEAVFVNANTDPSFISVVKQLREQRFQGALYTAYFGSSASVREALGGEIEGIQFCTLPPLDELISEKARPVIAEFRKRFGEPKSGFPVVPTAIETFRLLDEAIRSGIPPEKYLQERKVSDGYLSEYHFDKHGAVQGLRFEMQEVKGGKTRKLENSR